jgi:hypothetical protein
MTTWSSKVCELVLEVLIWNVLRLIQPGAPPESNMQRDMKWDVTYCTVTFPEQFSRLMAEEVDELLSPWVRKRPHT